MKTKNIIEIPLANVMPDAEQPRKLFEPSRLKNLRDSINKYGVMTPVTVEKIGEKYLLVDGERRFRVSTELGLKTIPAVVIEPQSAIDRLVQQFHIQEQHEEWTATEKALTVYKLSKELGVSLKGVCDLLALEDRTARTYMAFADIVDKKAYQKNDIGIKWAESIVSLKRKCKLLYEEQLEEDFTRDIEKGIENAVITRIVKGELKLPTELARLKDSFVKQPKSIEKFIKTDITFGKLFIETKAKGAYHLRQALSSSRYVENHLNRFMEIRDIKVEPKDVAIFKRSYAVLKKFIDQVEL